MPMTTPPSPAQPDPPQPEPQQPEPAQPDPRLPAVPAQPTGQPPPSYQYGTPGYGQPTYVATQPTNGLAIAALICAIAGLGPIAAVMGHVARKQIRQTGEQGDGLALAAVIVGWTLTGIYALCCLGYVGVFAFFATFMAAIAGSASSTPAG
jgi:hypothetical protein